MKVTVIGLGLIGGSFARAARAAGHETFGWDADPATREDAERQGIVLSERPRDGLVVVALPPDATAPWVREHAADFAPGTVAFDVCGVKRKILDELREFAFADWTFVGAHPMAGKELGGWARSDAKLFKGASLILVPYPTCGRIPIDAIESFARSIGFDRVFTTDPDRHDEMIAYTSQLAHVVSSAYVRDPLAADHAGYSAGSFQDMTRVATVDPGVWTSLMLANREPLVKVLDRLIDRLGEYRSALARGDAEQLESALAKGRAAKLAAR